MDAMHSGNGGLAIGSDLQIPQGADNDLASGVLPEPPSKTPVASGSSLRIEFGKTSLEGPYQGRAVEVVVPTATFGEAGDHIKAFATEIGGAVATRGLNLAVANYLLDREAFLLLSKEKESVINDTEIRFLAQHRKKWENDTAAEARAKGAGSITDKEAALLTLYRTKFVRDVDGRLLVNGVTVNDSSPLYDNDIPHLVTLVELGQVRGTQQG